MITIQIDGPRTTRPRPGDATVAMFLSFQSRGGPTGSSRGNYVVGRGAKLNSGTNRTMLRSTWVTMPTAFDVN